ncbi:hypothetical protein F4813DRAFT_265047 [Daldinia decipiens]|uniref:uncharacterized protein n=1 Tax=Daldinia decipiens TaxID=326647 RepID=UPI0020C499AC|nr:uncharacterized protein F4813DRAFT_265047 [Daldinia decipiens]KAI1660830.1 hypothetical protein F4813DRAFT_265047 [Daldinia decipiens]
MHDTGTLGQKMSDQMGGRGKKRRGGCASTCLKRVLAKFCGDGSVRFGSVEFVLGLVVYGRLMFICLGLGALGVGEYGVFSLACSGSGSGSGSGLFPTYVCGRVGAQQRRRQQQQVTSFFFFFIFFSDGMRNCVFIGS